MKQHEWHSGSVARIGRTLVTPLLGVISLAVASCAHSPASIAKLPKPSAPNFVFILGDDVGITDINAYSRRLAQAATGAQFYETPNLDRLVGEGVAFEQAYSTQLCSPTRAALLTGRFAPRLGFTSATPPTRTYFSAGLDAPDGEMPLDSIEQKNPVKLMVPLDGAHTQTALPTGHPLDRGRDVTTIAEALRGYRSVYLGKWHLGGHGAPGHAPRDSGFEELAWHDSGDSSFFNWREA